MASESKADAAFASAASASAAPAGSGKVDWSKVEELDVLLRPWLRIDGSLNRRVFDRLLGAVLGLLIEAQRDDGLLGLARTLVDRVLEPRLGPLANGLHVGELRAEG